MKILNARDAYLTNAEVYLHLKDMEEEQNQRTRERGAAGGLVSENLRTIQFEILKYMSTQTNCSQMDEEKFLACLKVLDEYELTKAEKLVILNNRPSSIPEIYACIEGIEERLQEEQMEALIEKINSVYP
ncbi:DNA-directed RNA polymerase III complex subunit Rpc17 [Schizosaccharomyces cryophilus OY26]|uniref:DNA-directed RNA polymerase III subunit RPC9 n=1 Tax=Schizosaccharomyces cryophilus (strain OY26 / ATCC MYA-4695 / CBS 11777 / NBRC 106824 / NRRL Y48691) TaxID=653667 RepID=S9VWK8_SCHCR|nr:DNA-directed RNA polymerase III complex subunit Rpc17 [Schizosaccharomyces cryophilus OY26]EPY52043.1 DNA-directed RNA polymerase III complex subunit Rpc17 [Schizosaccharomyces cryophilus OY26]